MVSVSEGVVSVSNGQVLVSVLVSVSGLGLGLGWWGQDSITDTNLTIVNNNARRYCSIIYPDINRTHLELRFVTIRYAMQRNDAATSDWS